MLGTDQSPNTYKKGMQILGNYQASRTSISFRASFNDTGVALLQRGGQEGRGGRGGQGKAGDKKDGTSNGRGGDDVSTMTGKSGDGLRTNSKGESHCFHCGGQLLGVRMPGADWRPTRSAAHQPPGAGQRGRKPGGRGASAAQCHVGTRRHAAQQSGIFRRVLHGDAFKNDKYLKEVKKVREGIKINCNSGLVTSNLKGNYGRLKMWYVPKGIANIFSMHKLECLYCITYNSWDGYYVIHIPRGEVKFHKDKQGLPYINLDKSDEEAAVLLIQIMEQQDEENEDGTKKEVTLV